MFLYPLISAHILCYYSNNKCEELLPYPVKKYLNRKISYFFSFIPKKHYTFALAIEAIHLFNLFRLQNGNHHWRDGRVVDYNGLENRRAERHRGFESLSLRKQGCKSASYAIYTLYYTQKVSRYFLYGLLQHDVRDSILTYHSELLELDSYQLLHYCPWS